MVIKKGGYIDDYANVAVADTYMLYTGPNNGSSNTGTITTNQTPGLNTTTAVKTGGSRTGGELPDNFLYSMEGGCSLCNSTSGGARRKGGNRGGCGYNKGGDAAIKKGGFGLEPFITALALLGARMLADKEVGLFNNKKTSTSSRKSSKYQDEDDDED